VLKFFVVDDHRDGATSLGAYLSVFPRIRVATQAWAHDATFVAHTAASPAPRTAAAAAGFHHFLEKGNSVADFEVDF
jgi:hypothetical protein